MKNVLFVSHYFPPLGGAGVQRSQKFVKYLPEFGYRPVVLSAARKDVDKGAEYDPTLLGEIGATPVYHYREYAPLFRRLANAHLGFLTKTLLRPDAAILAMRHAYREAAAIAHEYQPEIAYYSLQPWSLACLATKIHRSLDIPFVLDFRDPWIDSTYLSWPTKLHFRLDARWERHAVEAAGAVVVVTPTMQKLMWTRYPDMQDKIHLVTNGFDSQDFGQFMEPCRDDCLQIGYAGGLADCSADGQVSTRRPSLLRRFGERLGYRNATLDTSTHSPLYLLRALRLLLDECPELTNRIRLQFAGRVGDRNVRTAKQLGLEKNVDFLGYLSHRDAIRMLARCDALFLPMRAETDGRPSYIHSAKTFEYLALRKPILALVPDGDARDLIEQARAGWCINPYDVPAIKDRLREMIDTKQQRGALTIDPNEQFIQRFERRRLTGELARLFDQVLARAH